MEKTFFKIREWALNKGIIGNSTSEKQFLKLLEEVGELSQGLLKKDKAEIKDAIGDCVVVLTNLAAIEGFAIEECILSAYEVIAQRQGTMINGAFVKNK